MDDGRDHLVFVDSTAEESAVREAEYVFERMRQRRLDGEPVKLGGATGRTQRLVYGRLLALARETDFDLSKDAEVYFLDEYFGTCALYDAYARQFLRVGQPGGFQGEAVFVPRGCFFDTQHRIVDSYRLDAILRETGGEWEERAEVGENGEPPPQIHICPNATHPVLREIRESNIHYDNLVRRQGAGRIALLGIGTRGHIGFVERGAATENSGVMLVRLAPSTLRANSVDFSLFNDEGIRVQLQDSRYAITQGIGTILSSAGELVLSAHGQHKRDAVCRMLLEYAGPQNPAAFVKHHHRLRIFLDADAFNGLDADELEERGFRVRFHARRKTAVCTGQRRATGRTSLLHG